MRQNDSLTSLNSLGRKLTLSPSDCRPNSKIFPGLTDQGNNSTEHLLRAFESVLAKFQIAVDKQNYKMLEFQAKLSDSLLSRFDALININLKISEGIDRMGNGKTSDKQHASCTSESSPTLPSNLDAFLKDKKEGSLKQSIIGLKKGDPLDKIMSSLPPLPSLDQSIIIPTSRSNITKKPPVSDNSCNSSSSVILSKVSSTQETNCMEKVALTLVSSSSLQEQTGKINEWVGSFYNNAANYYFDQYFSGKINYEDMKIRFCGDILNQLLNLSCKWEQLSVAYGKTEKMVERRTKFYHIYNEASKRSLQFLITKYPPSRRKVIDSELSEKIKQVKNVDIIKHDILRNAKVEIGLDEKQTDFTKEIKILLNKLIIETNKEFPAFKDVMKDIFVKTDLSDRVDNEVEFMIGRKIPDGVPIYTRQELEAPGLQLKSTELLRILVKWCQELLSYFLNPEEKIYGNKFGFKNIKPGSLPIKILRSRLQQLVTNLKRIFQNEVKPVQNKEYDNMGSLIMDLINLSLDGVNNGYQFLNQREVTITKLCQYFNDSLKSYVLVFINLLLNKLVTIRSLYEDQKLQSNINLITFGVMDLLRCRCTGSKSSIYRIYSEIIAKKDYFEVIRIKNKLNEATRDIIINLKLKNSFLICQVQLSLGEAQEELNDHFCHFLYELERTSFGVLLECASQISNLDPRMNYVIKEKALMFKGSSKRKTDIVKSIKTLDNDICVCALGHVQTTMHDLPNDRPFCCSLCTKFIPSYTLCLDFFRCPCCAVTLCPECIIMMNRSNKAFIQKYTDLDEQCSDTNSFFYGKHLYEGMCESEKAKHKISVFLQQYPYILHVMVDNIGYKRILYKRYKNSFTEVFSTLPQVNKQFSSKLCWNYIQAMKPFERRTLQELKDNRKFHISLEWSQLQQILQENKLNEIICVVDNESKSVLIVDILESEEQIEGIKLKQEVEVIIEDTNANKQWFLEMTSKKITSIGMLDNIEYKQCIRIINLWENKIKDIGILAKFPNVQELFLRQNQIQSLEAILSMKSLELAFVSDNKIKGPLPALHLPLLYAFDISLNQITDISNISSSSLDSLVFFRMVSTKISSIPVMTLPKLEVFWFDHNGITHIDNLFNSNVPGLTKVSGTHNMIVGGLPEMHFHQLQNLILNYNQIESIESLCKSECPSLKTLSIHHNCITGSLPLMGLPSLMKLDLSYNKIVGIPERAFSSERFRCLEVLDLKCNQIHGNLPVLELPSIRKIDISNNMVNGIQALSQSKLPSLVVLDLAKNMISGTLPCIRFFKLQELRLSNNEISSMSTLGDSKLPNLIVLRCDSNKINTPIPKMYLQNLQILELSKNSIPSQEFMRHIHLLPSLKRVFARDNPQSLKESLVQQCDAQTLQMVDFTNFYLS